MEGYRCYFFGTNGHIQQRVEYAVESDELAIIEARARYAESVHGSGFELWQQARLVYAQGRVELKCADALSR